MIKIDLHNCIAVRQAEQKLSQRDKQRVQRYSATYSWNVRPKSFKFVDVYASQKLTYDFFITD